MGKLTVNLDKMRNLSDDDGMGRSDPYVKFELEEDNTFLDKSFGKKKSTVKKGDCNPDYDEVFIFDDVTSLDTLTLNVQVKDDDIGKDDAIGECKIKLSELNLSSEPTEIERVVDPKMKGGWFSRDAKVFLRLTWEE